MGQWERGAVRIELHNLIAAAELYGASLDHLVWGMGNSIDARLRKLPALFREPLIERIQAEIDHWERLARTHPEFSGKMVVDEDEKLKTWSAAIKLENLRRAQEEEQRKRKVGKSGRGGGTQ